MTAQKNGIRPCRADEFGVIWEIINDAAQAYQGVIPEDRWHEPCMSLAELKEQMERRVWEMPTNDVPCKFATPFAELEAVADFGNSNTTVRLMSPILSSEVSRLLSNMPK